MSHKPSTACLYRHIETHYPELFRFIMVYFCQDYEIFGETEEAVLKTYLKEERKEDIASCLNEMEDYIEWASDIGLSNDQFLHIFWHGYNYEARFKTSQAWVKHLLYSLKEMSKSREER